MKVLVTGGAGYVGTILRPFLEAEHDCTYFDTRPALGAETRTIIGDITNEADVAHACAGQDAVIQLVMANPNVKEDLVRRSYNVHVQGMHVLLAKAVEAGVGRVIYASSMSVYARCGSVYHDSEDMPPDATDVYGLTKRLGEEVCRAFAAANPNLSVLAFRMVLPHTPDGWNRSRAAGRDTTFATGPQDLGRLYLAGLALKGHVGFDAIQACSDPEHKRLNLSKAKRLLGWEPREE
ncbi:NAD-dependent epimerase/dehydratase family protein [Candidatus Poribacteria bacterium]|nr:NAD-dependent epimerase/dehydratase family protein [Candidatus Poribacteria bacterium]